MTNDLNTLNGSLQQMIDELETNLQLMGVNATYDSTTGIRGLIAQITDIEASVGGIELVTTLSCVLSSNEIIIGESITITGILKADKDDTSQTNVDLEGYLKGASIKIYINNVLIDTVVTDSNGEYTYTYSSNVVGEHTLRTVFEGTNDYNSANSSNQLLNIIDALPEIVITASNNSLSQANNDSATITATVTKSNQPVADKTVTWMLDETVLGTSITNSNGEATYTYNSQGLGDIVVTAKIGIISDSCNIEDCYEFVNSSNTRSVISGKYTTPVMITGSAKKNGSWGGTRIYGYDSGGSVKMNYCFLSNNSSNSGEGEKIRYNLSASWQTFKVIVADGTVSLYMNDTLYTSVSVDTSYIIGLNGGSSSNPVSLTDVKVKKYNG